VARVSYDCLRQSEGNTDTCIMKDDHGPLAARRARSKPAFMIV
jgi:hypothetical protein